MTKPHAVQRIIAVLLVAAAAVLGLVQAPAGASPIVNHFQGYDLTQTTPRPCDVVNKPYCSAVPVVNATSYFNTTIISTTPVYHAPESPIGCCGEAYSYTLNLAAGHGIGVLCYTGIWDKIDARQSVHGAFTWYDNQLTISYVPDSRVVLSYSDRVTYVPHC